MNTITDQFTVTLPGLTRGQLPLRGPDLPLLVSLDVLLEECNVTRAAARLHLSQPALSAQLARLRQLFDDPLLVPSGKGRALVPSQFAINLHRRLQPALATLSAAIREDVEEFRPETDARLFTIAATNTAGAMVMPALLKHAGSFGNRELKFATAEPDFARLASRLDKGEIDLCLSPACFLPPGLRTHDLLTTRCVQAQRRGHPRGTGAVSLDEYCGPLDHVNVSATSSLHGYIDEQLYRQGRSRNVAMAVRDFSFVPALLQSSDLVCTMPLHLAQALRADVELVEIELAVTAYTLCMAWHPRGEADPAQSWLRAQLQAVIGAAG